MPIQMPDDRQWKRYINSQKQTLELSPAPRDTRPVTREEQDVHGRHSTIDLLDETVRKVKTAMGLTVSRVCVWTGSTQHLA